MKEQSIQTKANQQKPPENKNQGKESGYIYFSSFSCTSLVHLHSSAYYL